MENNKKSNNNGNGINGPWAKGQGRGSRPRPPQRIIKKSNNNGYSNGRCPKTQDLKEMLIKHGVSCYSDLPGQVSHLVGFWLF